MLFAVVMGSMDLASMDRSGVRSSTASFRSSPTGVYRFKGTVNQYTGDRIMALFGAPIAHEDHAQRACYAALHLKDELPAGRRSRGRRLGRRRQVLLAPSLSLNRPILAI